MGFGNYDAREDGGDLGGRRSTCRWQAYELMGQVKTSEWKQKCSTRMSRWTRRECEANDRLMWVDLARDSSPACTSLALAQDDQQHIPEAIERKGIIKHTSEPLAQS